MRPTCLIILVVALLGVSIMAPAVVSAADAQVSVAGADSSQQSPCPLGGASLLVPAVTGEVGQMLNMSVSAQPGNGEIFMPTTPYVGVQTQNSEKIAISVATSILDLNKSHCDFLFRINGEMEGETDTVDGPSAGAAMTLMALSALSDTPLEANMSLTGTIEPDGTVGPVGSVSAKAEAAAKSGVKIFLVPKLEMYERLLLSGVRKNYNISVYEVHDIFEAAAIALGGVVPNQTNQTYFGTIVSDALPPYMLPDSPQVARFGRIAEETLADSARTVETAKTRGNGEFDKYFDGELAAVRKLLDKNYSYTGANVAFLTQVDASAIGRDTSNAEVNRTFEEVQACINGTRKPALRGDNFEEVFGGEVRLTWAKSKLQEVQDLAVEGEDANVFRLRELEYARGWCNLARRLFAYQGSGAVLNEALLKDMAKEKLRQANAAVSSEDTDAEWHLSAASEAYDAGDYGASLYDSAYALGMSVAAKELADQTPETLKPRVDELVGEKANGFWPNLYKMQVQYYAAANNTDLATSFRMAAFVNELDRTNMAMETALFAEKNATVGAPVTGPGTNAYVEIKASSTDALVVLAVLGILLIAAYEMGVKMGGKRATFED
ncbi:Archaeal Lon protease [Candidatus Burarchaeum australiense]|nr:Archaeal Lon protease [Candidatus Burarchaeum australiense]